MLATILALSFLLLAGAQAQQQQSQETECTGNDNSIIKDGIEQLNLKMQELYNNTQGFDSKLSNLNNRLSNIEEGMKSIKQEIFNLSHPTLGSFLNPASSCKLIPQDSPSGLYWIQHTGTGYAVQKHCDMTRRCNSVGGWMTVVYFDMASSTNTQCPSTMRLITSPKRTCGTPGSGCVPFTFNVSGIKYSKVCGMIKAYQYGSPDAFRPYYKKRYLTIDSAYVDGVSVTHGKWPRKHIWTFAAARDETVSHAGVCPCTKTNTPYTGAVPPFIGQDYFCDTGSTYHWRHQFYHADPLWDGSGCGSTSICCSFNNPPWFCKQLPQPTSDDIEIRICTDQSLADEYIAIEKAELYVQ